VEGPVSCSEQNTHIIGNKIRGCDIEESIAVQIRGGYGPRRIPGVEVLARLENRLRDADQHADVIGLKVRGDQIGSAVAVEITDRYEPRAVARGKVPTRLEGAVAVSEQDAGGAARLGVSAGIRNSEVGLPVAVDVSDCQRVGFHFGVVIIANLERA